jgi:hypothetical protein
VTAATIIMILERNSNSIERDNNNVLVITGISDLASGDYHVETIVQSNFRLNPSVVFSIHGHTEMSKLFVEMLQRSIKFGDITKVIIEGIVTPRGKKEFISHKKANNKWKKFIEGKDICRYYIDYKGKYINYDRDLLHRPRPENVFNCTEKLICQRISGGSRVLHFAYDNEQFYTFASTNVIILNENTPYNIKYVLGILNSKLLNSYYVFNFSNKSELTVNISKTYLSQLPIRRIDFNNPSDKKMQDTLVALVDKMLELNKRLVPIRNTPCNESDELLRETERTDKEIDNLVYDLYGLTEEERKIVEKG